MLAECQHRGTIGNEGVQVVTKTIRDVPDDQLARIERAATMNGRTIEQEVRELLIEEYSSKDAAMDNNQRGPSCNRSGDS